jgi:hypothetical protein
MIRLNRLTWKWLKAGIREGIGAFRKKSGYKLGKLVHLPVGSVLQMTEL